MPSEDDVSALECVLLGSCYSLHDDLGLGRVLDRQSLRPAQGRILIDRNVPGTHFRYAVRNGSVIIEQSASIVSATAPHRQHFKLITLP